MSRRSTRLHVVVLERIAEHHDVTRVLGADTITRVPPVWLSLEILRLLATLQDRRLHGLLANQEVIGCGLDEVRLQHDPVVDLPLLGW